MTLRSNCPICNHPESRVVLKSKDYSVSQEDFEIVRCNSCGFQYTNPIPDENVIGRYYKSESYVSHSSSKKGVINKIYHLVRWYSLRRKLMLVESIASGRSVLDIGAGTGHFCSVMHKAGWKVRGLEPDTDARSLAKSAVNIDLEPIEALHVINNEQFDIITMWHVLEHVYHLRRDFEKIASLLKSDGCLIIAVPNRQSYDAKYYKEYWAAYDLPIHLYHFVKADIERLAGDFGLELIDVKPMLFDSFYVSMLSEKYKGKNPMWGFLVGLKSNWLASLDSYSSQIYILKRKTH